MMVIFLFLLAFFVVGLQALSWNDMNRQDKFYNMMMEKIFVEKKSIDMSVSYDNYFKSRFWDHDFEKMIVSK